MYMADKTPETPKKDWVRNTSGLKPFKKGQSGNPSGRKKTDVISRAMIAELYPEAIAALADILRDTRLAASAARVKAAQIIVEHEIGKPKESVEIKSERPIVFAAALERFDAAHLAATPNLLTTPVEDQSLVEINRRLDRVIQDDLKTEGEVIQSNTKPAVGDQRGSTPDSQWSGVAH
jgi:hypothetical protein